MKSILFILAILFTCNTSGQHAPREYFPITITRPDLSSKTANEIKRQNELLKKKKLTHKEQQELDSLLFQYGEVIESIWDIIDGGCSWYCGGGNYDVKASSELKEHNKITYRAQQANDLSYQTAWIEGKKDEGIGEYLEFYFRNKSPRITKIIISNGYMKSESTWKNNNRVKKLRFYVNDRLSGILNLEDSRTDQVFETGTLGHNENGTDLVLRFEIAEIYKGDTYNDTAITEIYFDGIDVH